MATDNDASGNDAVDCEVLEAAKENIQPIAKGRRVTTLSEIFSKTHRQRDEQLAATRVQYRTSVEESLKDNDSDVLGAYSRFVNWTIEHYPEGHSAESGILELLEEATRRLKDDEKYKDDPRYLHLWVLYAGYVERPSVIYSYLVANDIGSTHARLYEQYSLALETEGRAREADEILLLGIARRAEPLEHLKNRHRDFQKRMMVNRNPSSTRPATPLEGGVDAPRRKALAPSTSTRSMSSTGSQSRSTLSSADDVFGSSLAAAPIKARPNGKMAVFIDNDEPQAAEGNPWPELGTRKTRVKENVKSATKMSETKLKQSSSAKRIAANKAAAAPKIVPYRDMDNVVDEEDISEEPLTHFKTPAKPTFVPFCDDDEGEVSAVSPKHRVEEPAIPASVMKPRAPKLTSEAEAIRKDPLRNFKT